ncbi:MAG: tetratricopeptide repeat protein [Chloroflexi bacterium]|nr:tetratricopeptide repeat protein [Chloroflexota bacterium]
MGSRYGKRMEAGFASSQGRWNLRGTPRITQYDGIAFAQHCAPCETEYNTFKSGGVGDMDALEISTHSTGSPAGRSSLLDEAHSLAKGGQWSDLARFLDGLADAEEAHTYEFSLLRAEAALCTGNPHEAVDVTNRLLVEPQLPSEVRVKAYLLRSSASRLRGFSAEAAEDAYSAMLLVKDTSSALELRIECHRQLGVALGTRGDLDEAVQQLEQALRLCARSSDLGLLAAVEDNLAVALAHLGQYPGALVYFQRAKAAYRKLKNYAALAGVLNNIGRLYYLLGQYAESAEALEDSLDTARKSHYPRLEATALVSLGESLQQLGRPQAALASYREALKVNEEVLEPRLSCHANIGIGSAECSLRSYDRARVALSQASYEAERLGLKYELALANLNTSVVDLEEGHHQKAATQLRQAIGLLERVGANRELLRGYLCLSSLHLITRRWVQLRNSLSKLTNIVQQLDLVDQLALEARSFPELVHYAASKRIGGDLFREFQGRMAGGQPSRQMQPAGGSAALPEPSALPEVHCSTFGKSVVTVDGREVKETEWRSQKAKELFLYLLCYRKTVTREELQEVLWPDRSANLSRNALHNCVYRARQALYGECIIQEGGRYHLNPRGTFSLDLEEFNKLVGLAGRLPKDSEKRAEYHETAIQLYRGAFLEDCYSDWSGEIRAQAEARYSQSLDSLADFHAKKGQHEEAARYLEKLLEHDSTNEDAFERLILLRLRQRETTAAYRLYKQFQDVLLQEARGMPHKSFRQMCAEAGMTG